MSLPSLPLFFSVLIFITGKIKNSKIITIFLFLSKKWRTTYFLYIVKVKAKKGLISNIIYLGKAHNVRKFSAKKIKKKSLSNIDCWICISCPLNFWLYANNDKKDQKVVSGRIKVLHNFLKMYMLEFFATNQCNRGQMINWAKRGKKYCQQLFWVQPLPKKWKYVDIIQEGRNTIKFGTSTYVSRV